MDGIKLQTYQVKLYTERKLPGGLLASIET